MENSSNTLDKVLSGIRHSVLAKMFSILVIALLLLIPATNIQSLISERQNRREEVVREVSSKWGEEQILTGPVLTIPYQTYYKTKDNEVKASVNYAHFLPEELKVVGNVLPEKRKRGIYEVVLYNADLRFTGIFKQPDFSLWNIDPEHILWDDAYISIGIPDMSGIQQELNLSWNNTEKLAESGLPEQDVFNSGLFSRVALGDHDQFTFSFQVDLNGSAQISFVPVGKKTQVMVTSDWPNPSFTGNFLPDDAQISDQGFKSNWKVLAVNRNFPQQWLGAKHQLDASAFGVNLLLPVNEYQKNIRSVKYALLVITLTFTIFFLIEILTKKRFHILQYVMVGFAIVLFYSLLISFTEHLGFNWAYLISMISITGLITGYVHAVFKQVKLTALVLMLLLVIYGFIFVILQMQDFALLMGSVGLLIALASLMYLSRHIDWYNIQYKVPGNSIQE